MCSKEYTESKKVTSVFFLRVAHPAYHSYPPAPIDRTAVTTPFPRPSFTPSTYTRAPFQATAVEAELTSGACFTRRASAAAAARASIENAALAFGNPPTAVTFAEAFLQDDAMFFHAMDAASHGHFLRDPTAPVGDTRRGSKLSAPEGGLGGKKKGLSALLSGATGASRSVLRGVSSRVGGLAACGERGTAGVGVGVDGEDWVQLPWLVGMGGFSLSAFLANRSDTGCTVLLSLSLRLPLIFFFCKYACWGGACFVGAEGAMFRDKISRQHSTLKRQSVPCPVPVGHVGKSCTAYQETPCLRLVRLAPGVIRPRVGVMPCLAIMRGVQVCASRWCDVPKKWAACGQQRLRKVSGTPASSAGESLRVL